MHKSVKLAIEDGKKIQSIQQEFNSLFPYLKIEFFSFSNRGSETNGRRLMKSSLTTIGECRNIHNSGVVYITPDMTVSDLESLFFNTFGLTTQIFRKSGKVWLETTVTDGWTLEKQNHQGEELSRHLLSEDRKDN